MTTQTDLFNDPPDPPQVVIALDEALWGLRCALGCVRGPSGTTAPHGAEPLDLHLKINEARRTLDAIERAIIGEREADACFGCNRAGALHGQPRPASVPVLDLARVTGHGIVPLCRTCARELAAAAGKN